ncbi:MAG: DUF4326 domain-containing protein [Beijerinckiaceae bacterium]|nr:DUF4326 domain-containing protein [Beijerinckiaceae bacterium]
MPERIQRRRAPGWRMPENAIYVGRPTRWGNPWRAVERNGHWYLDGPRVSPFRTPCGNREGAQLLAVECFRRNLPPCEEITSALRGKDLACWCKPGEPCHADVLLELANREG